MTSESEIPTDIRASELTFSEVLLFLVFGVLAFGPGLNGVFIYDDNEEIVKNPNVHHIDKPMDVMFGRFHLPVRPIPYLTFALNYAVHGTQTFGYHVINLGLHLANAILLCLFIRDTLLYFTRNRFSFKEAQFLSLAISLLWLVHPLQTQPVNYIYQRIEVLMSFFLITTFYFFQLSVLTTKVKFKGIWLILSVIMCYLGMLSKEVMIVTPLLLLWYYAVFVWPCKEVYVKERGLYFIFIFAGWLVFGLFFLSQKDQYAELINKDSTLASSFDYLLTQSQVILKYLQLTFWPRGQCFEYGWPVVHSVDVVKYELITIGCMLLATLALIVSFPRLGYVAGWFWILLGPTSSFLPVLAPANEHRMYLALLSPVTLFVLGVYWWMMRLADRNAQTAIIPFSATMLILITTLMGVSLYRSTVYTNYLDLWHDTAEKAPWNGLPFYQLGTRYVELSDYVNGEKYCRRAVELNPKNGSAYNNLGLSEMHLGRQDEAFAHFQKSLEADPVLPYPYVNLGNLLAQKDPAKALDLYHKAIALKPDYADAYVNAGVVIMQSFKNVLRAKEYMEQALLIDPNNVSAQKNLEQIMRTLAAQGRRAE
jgi:tetratricopeptide (TPR) repeat protein